MSDPFIGEIRAFGFNFAPQGWALCNGNLIPISQYQALFSILGTTYGGDGENTFGLPDLSGRMPVHAGDGPATSDVNLGQRDGAEVVSLQASQVPQHRHPLSAVSDPGTTNQISGQRLANSGAAPLVYAPPANLVPLHPDAVTDQGSGGAHDNMQPFLTMNYCIALVGVFPSIN
jgi:microcystin-dependent protein